MGVVKCLHGAIMLQVYVDFDIADEL